MGSCVSRDESLRSETAKLILLDGTLQEFSSPIKVYQILQKNPTSFICNSDEMDFDDAVSTLSGEEELRSGNLYFVLPMTWLNHPLRAEEMAALAVKASSALAKSGGGGCGGGAWVSGETKSSDGVMRSGRGGRGCGKRKRRFTASLSIIAE
ncbi:unnamed protein product [Cochlearia groenlandica]